MHVENSINRLELKVAKLADRNGRTRPISYYARYANDPVGFMREVFDDELLTDKQIQVAESVRDNQLTTVKGCNAAGKDAISARLALWHIFAKKGLAILTGPTERQVRETLMRRETRRLFSRAKVLDGEPFELSLRIEGEEQAGILAFSASDPDDFTGHHSPGGVLVIVTEAQGVEAAIIEAAHACTAGENDRLLMVGNPLRPRGAFYEACKSPEWNTITIDALTHPNVVQGREVIPGGVSRAFVEKIEKLYGTDSPQYKSRVLAEFPEEASEQLIKREWIDDANRLWRERAGRWVGSTVYGIDVAHSGPDFSAKAVYQDGGIRTVDKWAKLDTHQSAVRIAEDADSDLHAPLSGDKRERPKVIVDVTGIGWGVHDKLKADGWDVVAFIAAQSARNDERYANTRSEAGWLLREALEQRRLALPPNEELRDDLLALTWGQDSRGRVALDSKDEIKATLKRSPDLGDSVMIANWATWRERRVNIELSVEVIEALEDLAQPNQWVLSSVVDHLGTPPSFHNW